MGRAKRQNQEAPLAGYSETGLGPLFRGQADGATEDPELTPFSEPRMVSYHADDVEYNIDAIQIHTEVPVGAIFEAPSERAGARRTYQVVGRDRSGTFIRDFETDKVLLVPASNKILVNRNFIRLPLLSEVQLASWAETRGVPGADPARALRMMADEGTYDEVVSMEQYRVANWILDGEEARGYALVDVARDEMNELREKTKTAYEIDTWKRGLTENAAREVIEDIRQMVANGEGDPAEIAKRIGEVKKSLPRSETEECYIDLHQYLEKLAEALRSENQQREEVWSLCRKALSAEESCRRQYDVFELPPRGEHTVDKSPEEIAKSYDWDKGWNHVRPAKAWEVGEGELFGYGAHVFQRRGHRAVRIRGEGKSEMHIVDFSYYQTLYIIELRPDGILV